MKTFDETVTVQRPPEVVYGYLADIQDYSPRSIIPVHVKRPSGPTRVGTRWEERVRLAPRLTMTTWSEVTAADPPRLLAMRWTSPMMHGDITYTFEPCPEGTRFRYQETLMAHGPFRLAGGLLEGMLLKRLRSRILDLRDLAESGQGPRQRPESRPPSSQPNLSQI